MLNAHFPNPPIPLNYSDTYSFLIAVLLSAQSTDKRVNEVTPHLFTLAKTPQEMSKKSPDEIKEIIRIVGLGNTKSRAIQALSQILVDKYDGKVPSTLEELETLPGVGHKTASVVVSQMFHTPAFPVDTHIHRCAKRWGLSNGKSVEQTERDLKGLFPQKLWNTLHLQIIYFARAFCPAKKHVIEKCPICSLLCNVSSTHK